MIGGVYKKRLVGIFTSLILLSNVSKADWASFTSKYNRIAFDVFAGVMYQHHENILSWLDDEVHMTNSGNSFSLFGGIDFYLGGYYDKLRKTRTEYLVTPFIGMQMDVAVTNSKVGVSKYGINNIKVYNDFTFLGRIGMLFKLKFKTNLKLYATLGFTRGGLGFQTLDVMHTDNHIHAMHIAESLGVHEGNLTAYLAEVGDSRYKRINHIDVTFGAGTDILIKERLLIGAEVRVRWFDNAGAIENLSFLNVFRLGTLGSGEPDFHANHVPSGLGKASSWQYSIAVKVGWAFL